MAQEIKLTFEEAMRRLEKTVEELEAGELSLEEALKRYEEGVKMADHCQKRLTEAEKRIEVLVKTTGGKLRTEPLEGEGSKKKK